MVYYLCHIMKHTYIINGMTCNGCRTDVENRLNAIAGVRNATVDLDRKKAIISMDTHIASTTFQAALPVKYSITKQELNVFENAGGDSAFAKAETKESKLQQLKPLLLILLYIVTASVLLHKESWDVNAIMLDFMGLFYIVFSFFKMLDLKGFHTNFSMYDPLAKVAPVYGWIYPFIETALGLLFLMRFQVTFALVVTLLILGITTVGVTRVLLSKKEVQCACLGTALKLPMTEATFIENAIMIVMAIVMLIEML